MINLALVFTGSQGLVEFMPIMPVSFQLTKEDEFSAYYFLEVVASIVISRHFTRKLVI